MKYETRKIIRCSLSLKQFTLILQNVLQYHFYLTQVLLCIDVLQLYFDIFILPFSPFWQAGGGFIHSNRSMVFLSRVGFHSAWSLDHKLGICTFPHTRFQSLGPLSRLQEDSEPAATFSFQGFLHTCTLGGGLICKVLCNQEPANVLHAVIQVKVEIPKLYTFRFCLTYNSFIGDFNTLPEHQKYVLFSRSTNNIYSISQSTGFLYVIMNYLLLSMSSSALQSS